MSKLICAIDSNSEIVEGSLGFFKEKQLQRNYPSTDIVALEDCCFPKGYQHGHFEIDKKAVKRVVVKIIDDKEVKEEVTETIRFLVRKEQSEIDLIPAKTIIRTLKAQAFIDIDASTLTGEMKILVECLQEMMGK